MKTHHNSLRSLRQGARLFSGAASPQRRSAIANHAISHRYCYDLAAPRVNYSKTNSSVPFSALRFERFHIPPAHLESPLPNRLAKFSPHAAARIAERQVFSASLR